MSTMTPDTLIPNKVHDIEIALGKQVGRKTTGEIVIKFLTNPFSRCYVSEGSDSKGSLTSG